MGLRWIRVLTLTDYHSWYDGSGDVYHVGGGQNIGSWGINGTTSDGIFHTHIHNHPIDNCTTSMGSPHQIIIYVNCRILCKRF